MFSSTTLTRAVAAAAVWAAVPITLTNLGVGDATDGPSPDAFEVQLTLPVDDFHLVFPQDASVTDFTSSFGASRPGRRRHKGNDLMAPKMTPVYSVADGVVSIIRTSRRAGAYVAVDHGNGWESWYMHLNNDTPGTDDGRAARDQTYAGGIEVGDFVSAGQLIGFVGDSGNAEHTGSHTHFELHHEGRAVNPYPYLEPAYARALAVIEAERLAGVLESAD